MKCLTDPCKVHSHTVVLANTVGIIHIKVFGAELKFHYLLSLDIYILQTLNIIIRSAKEERAMVLSYSYVVLLTTLWRGDMRPLA